VAFVIVTSSLDMMLAVFEGGGKGEWSLGRGMLIP
jgi:hypothetical protein